MKKHYDRLHMGKVPEIDVGDYVLVWKGLQGSKAPFSGPYMIVKTARKQGSLKYICYNGPNNIKRCIYVQHSAVSTQEG